MLLVAAVDPPADDAFCDWVLKRVFEVFHYDFFIKIIDNHKRCLSEILVPYGDFACHDVRQGVNERRRAREEVLGVLYRRLIMRISL